MNEAQTAAATQCLAGAHDGTLDFPTIVRRLGAAGFESYAVDFRRGEVVYFLPGGEHLVLSASKPHETVAATFDAATIEEAVRAAQANAAGYTYVGFCERVAAAGCAGYTVSFLGRRVVYFGRTAETHVELFPS